ncbi:MAG TPA: hypothetical protein VIC62_03875, partial [Nakamurella sp.]
MTTDGLAGTVSDEADVAVPVTTWGVGAAVTPPAAPARPTLLSGSHGLTLVWNAVAGADGYVVMRAWQADGPFNPVAEVGGTIYRDTAAVGGVAFYRVRTVADGVMGPASEMVSGLIIPEAPATQPSAFVLSSAPPSTETATTLSLGSSTSTARAGAGVSVTAAGPDTTPTTPAPAAVEVQVQHGSAWQTVAVLAVAQRLGAWSAAGDVLTSGLAAGTYQVRAAAIATDGSIASTTSVSTLVVVHTAPAVTGVAATATGSAVQVSWQAAGPSLTYNVYRAGAGGAALTPVATAVSGTGFSDTALAGGLSVGYVVTAVDDLGNESPYSATAWVTTPAAWSTSAPTGGFLTPSGDAVLDGVVPVVAQVDAAAGVASLRLDYAPAGTSDWTQAGPLLPAGPGSLSGSSVNPALGGAVWATTLNTTGLAGGKYDLRLTVIDANGVSSQVMGSMALAAADARGPPTAGFDLTSTASADGVHLAWTGAAGSSFQVRRSSGTTTQFATLAIVSGSAYTDTHAIPGHGYTYQVVRLQPSLSFSGTAHVVAVASFDASGAVTSADRGLQVTVPGSLASRVNLVVTADTAAPALGSGMTSAGAVYVIDATSLATGAAIHLLDQPATLTFSIPAGISPAAAAQLSVFHWDEVARTWVREATVIDLARHVAIATVGHFSVFTVAGDPLSTTATFTPDLGTGNLATGAETITLSNNDPTSTLQYALDPVGFVDIAGTSGARRGLSGDDFVDQQIPLGFSFPLYGASYTTMNMNINGWLSP